MKPIEAMGRDELIAELERRRENASMSLAQICDLLGRLKAMHKRAQYAERVANKAMRMGSAACLTYRTRIRGLEHCYHISQARVRALMRALADAGVDNDQGPGAASGG